MDGMNALFDIFTVLEALGKTSMIIMVGLYFTFSNTVMTVLKSTTNGADVMVDINKVILNPLFMGCFILSGISSLWFVITAGGTLALSGGAFFMGTTFVTMLKNVPLNNQLRDATRPEIRKQTWELYLSEWVFWNHVRTFSAIVSVFLLAL